MDHQTPRLLFGSAAAIFAIGGIMHAIAYASTASARIGAAQLPSFFNAELKVLWLADSTTLVSLALIVGFIAMKPTAAARTVVMLLALIPGATTALLFAFLGPFYPGYMLLVASTMVLAAGVLMPRRPDAGSNPPGTRC